MSHNEHPELLTIQQACHLINVHPNTLRNWERNGSILALRIGRRHDRRYRLNDLLGLLVSASKNSDASPITAKPGQTETADFSQLRPETVFTIIGRYCVSLSQAAELTGYHEDYLGQAARLGELKATKIGRNWITLRSSLQAFCETRPEAHSRKRINIKAAARARFSAASNSP